MTNLYKAAKEKFPLNVIIALVVGILIGYFIATYFGGGAAGEAIRTSNSIVSGTYGYNHGARYNNVGLHLGSSCNPKLSRGQTCIYRIDYRVIGDPVPYKTKDYIAQWKCGSTYYQVTASPEANGKTISIRCPGLSSQRISGPGLAPLQPVVPAPTPAPLTCTSFTYSAWSSCSQAGTQTRTVTSSSPSGCTGGTPVLSQSCTYVAPVVCGNGVKEGSEVCDGGGLSCTRIVLMNGTNSTFSGTQSCKSDCSGYNACA